ncbi:Rha family transcriptional regulator [Volucribacter amazonae]|uniref:Rha family phage regulatory protein n=1 Tax=Volucribacter amazonae TaxID=256731 RepID=A0A9X4SH75_9PAST|nr:Rha family transcriptional regulator [Volucribacter amazonae]MDG6894135.1 hypothetical protein [Volucribacter amazonae]MDG6894398.1 hypothetical protein [Volucribacter amazonae]
MMKECFNGAVFPKLFNKEMTALTDSLKVASYFDKQHKNILRAIKELNCSPEFWRLNFKPSNYKDDRGKRQPIYLMTQDGFTLLVMGFTGKKAMQFKEAYINEFNHMRKWISSRANLKQDQQRLNDAIKASLERQGKDDPHAYSRENNLVYRVTLGVGKKKWLTARGYPKDAEIRQFLTEPELKRVDELLSENAVMIKLGLNYSLRKALLQKTALQGFSQH